MNFKPTTGRLLIKPDPVEERTASGIIIPDSARKEKPVTGEIIVGNETFKSGDRVIFSKYGFDEVDIEGAIFNIVTESNILGTF